MHARPLLEVLREHNPLAELTVQDIELSAKYFQEDDFMPDALLYRPFCLLHIAVFLTVSYTAVLAAFHPTRCSSEN